MIGYVMVPDHAHILVSEPTGHKLETAMQVIKQRFSRTRPKTVVFAADNVKFAAIARPGMPALRLVG